MLHSPLPEAFDENKSGSLLCGAGVELWGVDGIARNSVVRLALYSRKGAKGIVIWSELF